MSVATLTEDQARALVRRNLDELAPAMARRTRAFLSACDGDGLDAMVWEAVRTPAVQAVYWALGRSVIPPRYTVTNARDVLHSWHGFGLAIDVISRSKAWGFSAAWITHVASIATAHGLDWGGDWRVKDLPHFQFGGMKATPSDRARALFAAGGLPAVWRAVGADT